MSVNSRFKVQGKTGQGYGEISWFYVLRYQNEPVGAG
jgi:hypothetical protein